MSNSAPDSSLSELLLPDCVRFSCCSPIASIRFDCCSPFASASAAARHLCLLQLLLPDCVCFNCSPFASASAAARHLCLLQLLLPDCVCFNCSPIVSASAVAPRLPPLHLQLPDCVRFDCCSPILHPSAVLEVSSPCPMFCNILRGVRGSMVRRSRVTSLVPPHEHSTSVTHTDTQTHG